MENWIYCLIILILLTSNVPDSTRKVILNTHKVQTEKLTKSSKDLDKLFIQLKMDTIKIKKK